MRTFSVRKKSLPLSICKKLNHFCRRSTQRATNIISRSYFLRSFIESFSPNKRLAIYFGLQIASLNNSRKFPLAFGTLFNLFKYLHNKRTNFEQPSSWSLKLKFVLSRSSASYLKPFPIRHASRGNTFSITCHWLTVQLNLCLWCLYCCLDNERKGEQF